jgi:hypothetical protein
MSFDPSKHVINIKGKEYLPVQARLQWFREDHPQGAVHTQVVHLDSAAAAVKAWVCDELGHVLGSGHGLATPELAAKAQGRYLEKAETAAIGRALATAGYGLDYERMEEPEPAGTRKETSHWTVDQDWKVFWTWVKEELGLSEREAHILLDCQSMKEYQGSKREAKENLERFAQMKTEDFLAFNEYLESVNGLDPEEAGSS